MLEKNTGINRAILVFLILTLIASVTVAAKPVTESRVWSETYPVGTATPRLSIDNLWGNVRVRPGASGQISVTIDESRSAPDQARFERSLEMLKLNIEADTDGVSFRVGERFPASQARRSCRDCRVDYQFEVQVPPRTQIDVGTVTDGRIDVAGITGNIIASNVNGPIAVSGIRDCELLESVNGAVEVSFMLAPGQDCSIETVNGDITIDMPAGTGLDVAMDLFNGRMVSDFDVEPYALPAYVEHTSNNGRNRYRIQQSAGIRLEGGGPTFSISSLNGDIRIQESQ